MRRPTDPEEELIRRRAGWREDRAELEEHVERFVAERVADGLDERAARRLARIELGAVDPVLEELAERRLGSGLAALLRDARRVARGLRRSPTYAVVGILLVALGVAASTTLFTLVDRVLLRPLPLPRSERVVRLFESSPRRGIERVGVARGNLAAWRRDATSFDGLATSYLIGRTLTSGGRSRAVEALQATCDFERVAGLVPAVGRGFGEDECRRATYDSAAAPSGDDGAVVLSHRLWIREFGGDEAVVGRSVEIDRRPFRVVGVAAPEVAALAPEADLFLAWELERSLPRDQRYTVAFGRLREGASLASAKGELAAIASRLAAETPETNRAWGVELVPLREARTESVRPTLLLLLAASALLLLVACANLAILTLARAHARTRELAMHLALGARPAHLLRSGLVETAWLATAGGALGAGLSWLAVLAVPRLWPDLPRLEELAPDPRALLFALAAAALTTFVAGWIPALRASRLDPRVAVGRGAGAAHDGAASRTRRALVVGELALTVVLLGGAGLMLRTMDRLRSAELGFDPADVLVAPVFLDSARYDSGARVRAYYDDLLERLRALPGVVAAGGATTLPTSRLGPHFDRPVWPSGRSGDESAVRLPAVRIVTPGYFAALRIPIVAGRGFDATDGPDADRVVVLSRTLAEHLFPGSDAIGRRVVVDYSSSGTYGYRVIGVADDLRFGGPRSAAAEEIYFPHAQRPYLILHIAVRTAAGAPPVASELRRTLLAIDPRKPPQGIVRLTDLVGETFERERRATQLMVGFAGLASLIAAVGLYGLLTFQVRRRAGEIGVRIALGAGRGRLVRWIAGETARIVAVGGALGALAALAGSRLLSGLLYGVDAADPVTALVVAALLVTLGASATVAPAWRAASLDAASLLRRE